MDLTQNSAKPQEFTRTRNAQAHKKPAHGSIRQFFACVYDANIREWIMVPCSRADLLKRVLVLS
jgi:hypothetical protein